MKNCHGKRIVNGCYTISKYVNAVLYMAKHGVSNQAFRMLYHNVIDSGVQYKIIAWEELLHGIYRRHRLF